MKTVLVVDDEPDIREVLEAILKMSGYNPLTAENGKDGLALFNEHTPDLVITDLVMPIKSGIDMIYAIRATGSIVPILAISGGGGGAAAQDILNEAEHAGANAAMPKPFLISEIKEAVALFIEN